MARNFFVVAFSLSSIGCVSTQPIEQQKIMTLGQAICEVQNAIVETRRGEENRADLKVGEATVVFQLGIKETNTEKLGAKIPILDLGPEFTHATEGTQGNTLTIKFVPGDTHMQTETATKGQSPSLTPLAPILPNCSEIK